MKLKIHEIFYSIQGESSRIGLPTVFIRLTGCPMRCVYCDTAYAFSGGSNMEITDILAKVVTYGTKYVTVTGGEPLAQKDCHILLKELCDTGYSVSLETGGAIDISLVDKRVSVILDVKTPGSGEVKNNLWGNLAHLKKSDEVKFVLCSRADYDWAKEILVSHQITDKCPVLFSPVYSQVSPTELAEWVLADKLPVRMQVQLHKILWGEKPGV
ncbi:7-carboxy-7-deazaguanine synthase QueE [Methylotenera sp.]|uniref:7-carboxy-7-deazaguanine synthase QueE n=1 Tax=Methylotenera sp. TaxID=2051956 RepID=UPI00272F24CD|nr:7-carboxy-7-deazaguanine synthase QueE [Methylotenera sp.]MDP2070655.1 7-carboxy-7-deazaguanine synthase QueE [Methylotenera sp.]MDP2231261.1 7-carboxy-7-deazaguanine synthase QueE [Methylotenera sp.]MDP3004864.1 7-carboxy-7-deazaguanine synthase QueE [Methylotenera sp.]MDP3140373.1 7-carboxy-7-deazaguanine synthase QueE [Methylotenera sp.]